MSLIRTAVALSVVLLGLSTSLPAADDDKKLDAGKQTTIADSQVDPLDWPSWRGPEQNGISRETGLIDSWDPRRGTNVVWKKPELATRSTPIVMHGKLYVLCRHEPDTTRDAEKLVCADAATGEILWENIFNVFLSDVPPERVGWSNCAGDPATGRVYALGVCGLFLCIDGETGQTIWSRSLSEEFGLLSTYGGRTNTPVIFEDLVIISAVMTNWGELALPAHRFLAFNKNTGEVVWFNGTRLRPDDTTYSTPALAVLGGQAAMVFGSGDGAVWALQPRTGVPIWSYRLSIRGLNISPIVDGDTIYMAQSEENRDDTTMGAFVAIDGSKTGDVTESGELWRVKQVMVGKSSPLLVDGRLYALDDANVVYIIDPATGKQIGKTRLTGRMTRASPVYADGRIYACTTTAWHVLEPAERGAEVVHQLRFRQGEEVHGSPIVSHGRIYLPTTSNMYCLGSEDAQTAADERPAPPQETPPGGQDRPAHLQVVPAESLIEPGEAVQLKARLFNDRGQPIADEDMKLSFSLEGGGQVSDAGVFTADSVPAHTGSVVTVKVGGLAGAARIRVVPPLPWKFDFDETPLAANKANVKEGEPPITWIGARYRHKIRQLDGETVMVKVSTIPKGTRSQSWMGHTDLSDYTIQADVRGATNDGKLPQIGLIAQRYTLDLMGNAQSLQIRSWTSHLDRFSKTVPFAWEADRWYTMKFRAATEDGKAVLRGKVWPRGESEPDEWSIRAVDEAGNLAGSPGLFGKADDAEIYLDNITITAN
ncbi:MAG: PQQ-binding-like beta-propeller repeat protein [Pirellulales bacterium]